MPFGQHNFERWAKLLFTAILACFVVWIFALPLFPTQDGPMHRYYVHVLHSLLEHKSTYSVYEIRHPLPPYLTHYGILLALFHVLPYDLAEEIFACLVILCFAYGLRLSAKEIGANGEWAALLVSPLLFSWPLMMGFFNFVLGLGLLLFCTAYWQRMKYRGVRAFIPFLLLLIVLTFTHPIPLLLLILLSGIDLCFALFLPREGAIFSRLRAERVRLVALALTVAAAAFPALAIDSTKTARTMSLFFFHPEFLRTALLLTGISPYNSRSPHVSINLYRIALYAIYFGGMWIGGRACIAALRARRPNYGITIFLATALLTVVLPFLPNVVNGSDYFATRLIFILWPGALLAASAANVPTPRSQRRWLAAGAVCCVLALLPAQLFIRPIARQLHTAELQPLPHGVPGALLFNLDQDGYVRFHDQLAFDPFKWGGILAFVHANDIALDSPWIDQKITPIEAVPGGPELVADISYSGILKPPAPDAPAVPGRSFPAWGEARMVRDSAFMVFSAPPDALAQGLTRQLTPAEAAKYHCGAPQGWYLVCMDSGAAEQGSSGTPPPALSELRPAATVLR